MRERLLRLPINVFPVLDGEYVQPLGTDAAVENAIRPDSVGPDLVFLKQQIKRVGSLFLGGPVDDERRFPPPFRFSS